MAVNYVVTKSQENDNVNRGAIPKSNSGSPSACKAENKAREEAKMNLLREVNRGPSLRGDAAKSLFLASG